MLCLRKKKSASKCGFTMLQTQLNPKNELLPDVNIPIAPPSHPTRHLSGCDSTTRHAVKTDNPQITDI